MLIEYTEKEMQLLRNTMLSAKEVSAMINVSPGTVRRARKRFDITVKIGAIKNKPNPARSRREVRNCKRSECNNTFEVILSHSKRYCSHSCDYQDNPRDMTKPRTLRNPNTPAYKRYANKVHRLSQKTYEANIDIINPKRHKRTLCGVENGYQLDHIMTIKECFEKNIPAEEAARVENLRMLEWKENLMRQYDDKN